MIRADHDAAIDRILSYRAEPLVPQDLARRIVVRTAHLPQLRLVADPAPNVVPTVAIAAAPHRWRPAYYAGGAIAASLTLFVAVAVNFPTRPAGPVPQVVAASERTASPALVAAMESQRTSPRVAPKAIVQPSARSTAPARPEGVMLAAAEPVAPVAGREGEAFNSSSLHPSLEQFVLADKVDPPVPVYGPVNEPDRMFAGSSFGTPSGSGSAMAISASRPGGSAGQPSPR